MNGFGIAHFAGVYDARMVRIYRLIGSSPDVLGTTGTGRDAISVGLWEFTPQAQAKVAAKAGLSLELSRLWFNRAFGDTTPKSFAEAG
jgi:acyl homoserine lactone synthase